MGRQFAREGLGYAMRVSDFAIEISIDRLSRTRGELHGELSVACGLPNTRSIDGHLHQARFNVSGGTARGTLARTLAKRANTDDIDWEDLLEDFCRRVMAAEREGDPMTLVGALPVPVGEDQRLAPILPDGQPTILYGEGGTGKALALDTPIPTPTGWTTMGEITVGDYVYDDHGVPTRVVAATPVLEGRPCYRVQLSDGSAIVADADHLWLSETHAYRNRPSKRAWKAARRGAILRNRPMGPHAPSLVTTRQMAETLVVSGERNHAIRVADPLLGNERALPIEPYALGAWLGDGTSASAAITSADPEIVAEVAAGGTPIRATAVRSGRTVRYSLSTGTRGGPTVQAVLRDLGVLGNKHIPALYLRASFTQRLALLQGLMDTDGTVDRRGGVSYTTTSRALADGVYELIASLGMRPGVSEGRARIDGRDISAVWDIAFVPRHPVFRLPRKAERVRPMTVRAQRRYVVGVEQVPSVPVRCIQVAAASGMFLAGRAMVPTHNSTLAAAMAVSVETGVAVVPGWVPRRGPILYLDWEAGQASVNRRIRGVAMGAHIPRVVSVRYLDCRRRGPLHAFAEDVARLVDQEGVALAVIDSVGMASGVGGEGGDANESAIRLFTAIGYLGCTVLAIDHVSKAEAEATNRPARPYGCYSADTEVLTRRGWRRHADLAPDDAVLGFDPATEALAWERPTAHHAYRYRGPMHRWATLASSALVTPNHRMLVRPDWPSGRDRPWQYVEAEAITTADWRLVAAGRAVSGDDPGRRGEGTGAPALSDDILTLLGWWISEGAVQHRARPALRLSQNAGALADRVDATLDRLGYRYWRQAAVRPGRTIPHVTWVINGEPDLARTFIDACGTTALTKRLPAWWPELTLAQRHTLLEALVDGDGHRLASGGVTYATSSPQLADDIQALAISCGLHADAVVHHEAYRGRAVAYYHVNISRPGRNATAFRPDRSRSIEDYDGMVYCLTVPSGAYVTRLHGRMAIHGNSIYKTNLARATYELRRQRTADGSSVLGLYNTKANDAALLPPLALRVAHGDDGSIAYDRLDVIPTELAGPLTHADRLAAFLADERLTVEQLSDLTGLPANTIRATLSRHKRRFNRLGSGAWELLPAEVDHAS